MYVQQELYICFGIHASMLINFHRLGYTRSENELVSCQFTFLQREDLLTTSSSYSS